MKIRKAVPDIAPEKIGAGTDFIIRDDEKVSEIESKMPKRKPTTK